VDKDVREEGTLFPILDSNKSPGERIRCLSKLPVLSKLLLIGKVSEESEERRGILIIGFLIRILRCAGEPQLPLRLGGTDSVKVTLEEALEGGLLGCSEEQIVVAIEAEEGIGLRV
jgi:hypothetical protein